ncbi:hypothetical protein RB595_001976 [Gaeumannomyces hyphopodioides]
MGSAQIPPIESVIEELAARTESASVSGHGPEPPAQDGGLMPELPPALAAVRNKTTEEILADLNKSPLFMTELEENDDVAALQALAYEGTPLENASDFKERGNECFKEKKWADAKEFYTKGINILAAEVRRRARGEPPAPAVDGDGGEDGGGGGTAGAPTSSDDPDEVAREAAVLESLYVNRAACHLELRNNRSCTLDCAAALQLNGRNIKALYRSARALARLDKVLEAEDAAERGLALDPDNAALRAVRDEVAGRRAAVAAKQKRESERAATEVRRRYLLRAALRQRGVRTRSTDQPPEMEDARCQLVPDPDDAEASSLAFPTMILYPVDMQSDFIKAFREHDCVDVHLSYLLPLPWDRDSAYTQSGVECYVETAKGTLLKLGKKVPLIKVLALESMEVVDELVGIFVLPKAKAAKWVKEFKGIKSATST